MTTTELQALELEQANTECHVNHVCYPKPSPYYNKGQWYNNYNKLCPSINDKIPEFSGYLKLV